MKKRYSKFFALNLGGSVAGCINFLFFSIVAICTSSSKITLSDTLPWLAVFIAITVLLSMLLLRKVPKGERLGVWFRCFWLGFKISLKITLFITVVFIGISRSIDADVSEKDQYNPNDDWYNGKTVIDEDGNEYIVEQSGDYVKDKLGKSHRVTNYNGKRTISPGYYEKELH